MAEELSEADTAAEWPLRPWLLAALLGAAGLLIHLFTHEKDDVPWRVAVAAFLFFGALAAALTIERQRWREPSAFAVAIGLVMAGLAWRAIDRGGHLADAQYGFASGVVATGLALPLFQAGFLRRRFATPYAEIYRHIWTDAIAGAGALAFTGLSWVALAILSELFRLLKIEVLHDLMEHGWFGWTFSGLAFGAALGVLRNEAKVLGTLRTVVLLVLSLIAVPLAIGLVLFLVATAVSGPQVLWEATRRATPVLLTCAAGAFVLVCVILRQDDAAITKSRVQRWAALTLAIVILPLAAFAAVSLGLRLNQYGLAPERLWALVTVIVACAWGLGYWGALIRGRGAAWPERLREANFILALGTCGLALLLALPILDFGAISARNQVQRLESGKVSPDKFDFAALRWDFGDAGRRVLGRLSKSGNTRVSELAQAALDQKQHVFFGEGASVRTASDIRLRVQPEDAELRRLVLDYLIARPGECRVGCVALDVGKSKKGLRKVVLLDTESVRKIELPLPSQPDNVNDVLITVSVPGSTGLTPYSKVEIRPVTKSYVFVDGKPVGGPLE